MTYPPVHPAPGWGYPPPPPPRRRAPVVIAVVIPILLALGLVAALSFAAWQLTRDRTPAAPPPPPQLGWQPYVDAGSRVAKYLTSIDHRTVDRDVQRVLDNSTGEFHDDFSSRSAAFIDTVRQSQSVSSGTVSAAGIESVDGNRGQVLVAVNVETNTDTAPSSSRVWRLRMAVVGSDAGYLVETVEFLP